MGMCLASCSSSHPETADAEDSVSQKLVKSADITFKVKNTVAAEQKIGRLVASVSGLVMHHSAHSSVDQRQSLRLSTDSVLLISSVSTRNEMTVRMPSEYVEPFMDSIAKLAIFVDQRNLDVEDRTFAYLENAMKAGNRQTIIDQQISHRPLPLKDLNKALAVKDGLSRQTVDQLQTDAAVAESTLRLTFYANTTVMREMMANTDLSAYRVPFSSGIKNGLASGWYGLLSFVTMMSNAWVFLVLGSAGYWLYRYYQKSKSRKGSVDLAFSKTP